MYRTILLMLVVVLFPLSSSAADVVVARVNGTEITAGQVDAAVDRLIPRTTYHGGVSQEKRHEFRDKALDDLIVAELQYQDALARGITPSRKRVKARMKEVRRKFRSRKAYKAALKEAGITHDELKKRIQREVRIETAIQKTVKEPSSVTEEELREQYRADIARFKQPESVRMRIISTKDEKKARDLLARVNAGEDFGRLAAQYSEDKYRIRGGDVGYIHRGRILPEIEKMAFSLKPGETSGLLYGEKTWFIIRVEEKQPERQLSFDDVKEKMKKKEETKRADALMEKWMKDLRARAKIEIVPKK